jgi:UDP-N-acetylmuramyl tripeptide synthase
MGARLTIETAAARLVGSISRVTGRGGGTTLPGKLLWKVDPGVIDQLATRLHEGTIVLSGTNGKTTTTAMTATLLGSRHRLAWNSSGANLASGVASSLLDARDAELGVFEVDEFALPELVRRLRPRVVALSNLFRDQLDRYGELEHIAERWRAAVAELPPETTVVVNGDDPLVASLADGRTSVLRYGLEDPGVARPALQHAADSKYCVHCGAPYVYEAAYVGHLGAYRCPACGHARPPLDVVAREVVFDGLDAASCTVAATGREHRLRLPLPGLYNVYNALAAVSIGIACGVDAAAATEALSGFRAAFGRVERIDVAGRTALLLLIKNPAGANEVVRSLQLADPPAVFVVALNDDIADGRDVSWIWDVDFEPLLEHVEHVVVSGDRAAELALRFVHAGVERETIELVPSLEAALDRGLALVPDGGRLVVLPTYTAMLKLRAVLTRRGHVRPYWEARS